MLRFCTKETTLLAGLLVRECAASPVPLQYSSSYSLGPSTAIKSVNSKWRTPSIINHLFFPISTIHTCSVSRGLEEFFPKTDNIIEEGERAGRPWSANELRLKSNEDLHKLWYVLLKERNMLLTLDNEAKRHRLLIPAPERASKVRKSMARLKFVLHERNTAIKIAKQELGLISAEDTTKEPYIPKRRWTHRKK